MILWFYKFLILKRQILRRTHVTYGKLQSERALLFGWFQKETMLLAIDKAGTHNFPFVIDGVCKI